MLRLAKVLVIIFLLAPISASPLGLGDIRLHSALNQQLDAEIDMIALGQTRAEDIIVRLATREAFERAGVERPLFLSRLRFEVEPGPGNTANIRIRSDQPVREPFLNFLVEVNWPNGRLLREYTVLLDPPLFLDEAPSAIVAPAVSVAETPARVAAPLPAATTAVTTPTVPVPGRLSASMEIGPDGSWSYGPVQTSDTLWSIAREMRVANESVSIEQLMMSLLRNNPEAFFNNNINELRAGHVLRIDDQTTLGEMSHAEAVAEVRRQYAQWQDAKGERAGEAGPRPLGGEEGGTKSSSAAGSASDTGPRLRLSAPDTADAERFAMTDVEAGDASQSDAATVSRLREDLVSALEISESARQENLELRQRLADLEEQISAMQRLMSLQDDTMSALQAGVGSVESQPTPKPTTEAEAVETPTTTPPVAVAPAIIPDITGLITTMSDDPMMLGVAAFLLLMLATLGWLVVRRRQAAGATLGELDESPLTESRNSAAFVQPVAAGAVASPGEARATAQTSPAATMEGSIEESGDSEDDIGLDIMQAEDDEIDILAEAEVYLAYRRFDKAEELLRDAIANEPGRQDLELKLLEVHAGSGNAQAFIAQAESLHASLGQGDATIWDKVAAMGRRLAPGHALFAHAGAAPAEIRADADSRADADAEVTNSAWTAKEFSGNLDDIEPDFSAGSNLQDGGLDFTRADFSADAPGSESFADLDLTLDDETLARLETGTEAFASGELPPADEAESATAVDSTLPGGDSADGLIDNELEKQLLAAGSAQGSDVDWLSEIGKDLDFSDMEGDENGGDFSGLISGEDEVGTKLDLARAYIDMGDQDSARSILNEVTEEGTEDQQRQANDLMRRIG